MILVKSDLKYFKFFSHVFSSYFYIFRLYKHPNFRIFELELLHSSSLWNSWWWGGGEVGRSRSLCLQTLVHGGWLVCFVLWDFEVFFRGLSFWSSGIGWGRAFVPPERFCVCFCQGLRSYHWLGPASSGSIWASNLWGVPVVISSQGVFVSPSLRSRLRPSSFLTVSFYRLENFFS